VAKISKRYLAPSKTTQWIDETFRHLEKELNACASKISEDMEQTRMRIEETGRAQQHAVLDDFSNTLRPRTEGIHTTSDEISRTVDRMCMRIENFQFPEPYVRERQRYPVYGHNSVSGPRSKKRRPF
jgi:hypothetical protein